MKRIQIILVLVACCGALTGLAQSSLSFYHLGNATYQNSYLNPSMIPRGKVFVGLPALSGVHVGFNNKFAYRDVVVQGESGRYVDLNTTLSALQRRNMVSTNLDIALLHIGITNPQGIHFSFIANERIEVDFLYPKSLIEFAIAGNGTMTGQKLKIGKTRMAGTHFREFGLGFAAPVKGQDATVGARLKFLQGFANASTNGSFQADLTTDPVSYAIILDMHSAELRTSGLDIYQGKTGDIASHMIFNGNMGTALDLGMSWDMDRNNSFAFSIADLGFISWKEDIKNHVIPDTSMVYSGFDLKGIRSITRTVQDSLINRYKDRKTTNNEAYTTFTSPKVFGSWVYHTPAAGDVVSTVGTRFIQGQWKWTLGVGYRHRFGNFFTGSLNVTRLPQQFLNVGAALAVRGGPAQFYLAADQVVNFDATAFRAFDVRVGLNLVFGAGEKQAESPFASKQKAYKAQRSKVGSSSFLGSKVEVKGQEEIYTIITKQDRRNPKEYLRRNQKIPNERGPKLRNTESQSKIPNKKIGTIRNKPPKGG